MRTVNIKLSWTEHNEKFPNLSRSYTEIKNFLETNVNRKMIA